MVKTEFEEIAISVSIQLVSPASGEEGKALARGCLFSAVSIQLVSPASGEASTMLPVW